MSKEQQEVADAIKQVQDAVELLPGTKSSAGFTSLGKCLQQARLKAGYSVQQVASEMHLDAHFIEFIERDRLKELGVPVFVKGHLRRYARLVNVDEALLQGLYDSLRDPPVAVDPIPINLSSIQQPRKLLPNWTLWAAAVFVVVSAGTVLNKLNSSGDLQASNQSSVSTVKSTHTIKMNKSPLTEDTELSQAQPEKHAVVLASAAPVAAANAHESDEVADTHRMVAPGHVALTLKFSGDSWVEIYDANKRSVFHDMGHNSNVREVEGVAPLHVVLGSSSQVTVQVNGRAAVIPAGRVRSSVARFMVDATGGIN